MLEVESLSDIYTVRQLDNKDVYKVLELEKGNPLYFEFAPPAPSVDSILDDMRILPPNMRYEDKYYVGYFDHTSLVAVMDIIVGYPQKETIFIGFFMMNKVFSGRGIGSRIIAYALNKFLEMGYSKARLGYMKNNMQSKSFWYKCGFIETGEEVEIDRGTVVAMEKVL